MRINTNQFLLNRKKVAERENPSKKTIEKPIQPTQTIETKPVFNYQ